MLALENAEEVLQILDRFTKQKSKDIPPELDEYLNYVAKTGDTVYRWPTVQYLFREKLINVIKEFHDTTASIEDLPQCPNVDQFNYESMKSALLERLELFHAAPFTIQRLCELLTDPKKHYSRLDKFMRALEKNILVVSTVEPGRKTADGEENGEESINGDILSEINIDMEINKEILKMGDEANGSVETIDTIATKLNEETAELAAACSSTSANDALTSNGNVIDKTIDSTQNATEENVDIEKVVKTDDLTADAATTGVDEIKVDDISVDLKENELLEEDDKKSDAVDSKTTTVDTTDNAQIEKDLNAEISADISKIEQPIADDSTVEIKPEVVVDEISKVLENNTIETSTMKENLSAEIKSDVQIKTDGALNGNGDAKLEDLENITDALATPAKSIEKPLPLTPTEKHPRDDDEDDNGDNDGHNAKKIRLDVKEIDNKAESEPPAEIKIEEKSSETIPIVELPITESNDDEIPEIVKDATVSETKVEPLLETSDSVIANVSEAQELSVDTEKQIAVADEVKTKIEAPLIEEKPIENNDAIETLTPKLIDTTDEASIKNDNGLITAEAKIPEAGINDLIPGKPNELIDVPADLTANINEDDLSNAVSGDDNIAIATKSVPPNQECMTVEETEGGTIANIAEEDAETAMEAAPIKLDDEQMDVDESNSNDPMDL